MRRFFILASAAIVALASCAKTQVVYNDAPEEIALKQITGVMTKVSTPYQGAGTSLGVFANQGPVVYFSNLNFAWTDDAFKCATPQYWPNGGTLDFTVYAPAGTAELSNDCSTLTIKNVAAGETLYYGQERYVNKSNPSAALPVALKHASAKISVTLAGSNLFKVTDLTIADVSTTGNVVVTYATVSPYGASLVATDGNGNSTLDFVTTEVGLETTPKPCEDKYVLPGAQKNITIKFQQKHANGTTWMNEVTKTIQLSGNWVANTAYTYNISIDTDEIKFTATVEEWEGEEIDKTQANFTPLS